MCFTIAKGRRAPRTRVAWKVLRLLYGTQSELASIHSYGLENGFHRWLPGQVKVANDGVTTTATGDETEHGIYVFLTEEAAIKKAMLGHSSNRRLVKVLVDPKDFLFRSEDGAECTYSKVRLSRAKPRRWSFILNKIVTEALAAVEDTV